jgi:hypothetical protein
MIAGDAGYLWSGFTSGPAGCTARLLEAGETRAGAALPALLDELFAQCRNRGAAHVEAWLTPDLAARDARLRDAQPVPLDGASGAAVLMWAALDPEIASHLERLEPDAAFHLTDLF